MAQLESMRGEHDDADHLCVCCTTTALTAGKVQLWWVVTVDSL